jgi:DNA-binding Lrp family transcriptional regulator
MSEPAIATDLDRDLEAEYREVAKGISEQRERAERLQRLADRAREQADRGEQSLRELAELLGIEPQMCLESLDERLSGHRLREIAVQVLAEHHGPGQPVHYKDWYALLRDAGYAVGGQDPLRNFLTSVSKAPEIEAVGRRTGLYLLKPAAA